jgi:hypothetical protein
MLVSIYHVLKRNEEYEGQRANLLEKKMKRLQRTVDSSLQAEGNYDVPLLREQRDLSTFPHACVATGPAILWKSVSTIPGITVDT